MGTEKRYIVGIDEVGRGALAGPVVVGAVMMPRGGRSCLPRRLGALKDSKKLSARKREQWRECFAGRRDIFFATARVYPRGIEKMNISSAANDAAARAFEKVMAAAAAAGRCAVSRICLDGGLYLGAGKKKIMFFANAAMTPPRRAAATAATGMNGKSIPVRTIIKGDEKITAIAAASIIAKVARDRYMARLAKKYPAYGFEIHKGYGTKAHFRAIRKHGASIVHRKTFL